MAVFLRIIAGVLLIAHRGDPAGLDRGRLELTGRSARYPLCRRSRRSNRTMPRNVNAIANPARSAA